MVCKSSLFLSWLLHKNIKGKMRIYVTIYNIHLITRLVHSTDNSKMIWLICNICIIYLDNSNILIIQSQIVSRFNFSKTRNVLSFLCCVVFFVLFVFVLCLVSYVASVSWLAILDWPFGFLSHLFGCKLLIYLHHLRKIAICNNTYTTSVSNRAKTNYNQELAL